MIVCICKNINSDQIIDAFQRGAHTLEDVRAKTEAGTCCGKCQFKINALVQDQQLMMQHARDAERNHTALATG